jgi:hypothetical protein
MKLNFYLARMFIVSAGVILLITAIAKIISAHSDTRILQMPDPVFFVSFRHILWAAGMLELVVAVICLTGRFVRLQAGLVALLATTFLIYRLGLASVGWQRPCPCLGNLTDAIHVSPQVADNVMKGVLAYLLVGSCGILFHQWLTRKAEGRRQNDEVKPAAIGSEIRADS